MTKNISVNEISFLSGGPAECIIGLCPEVAFINSLSLSTTRGGKVTTTISIYGVVDPYDPLTDDRKIAVVVFNNSTTGTVTIVNKGHALSNKSRLMFEHNPRLAWIEMDLSITYTPPSIVKYYDGTQQKECTVNVYNGTSFDPCEVLRYDGSAWKECTFLTE
jgi:hypothetical protein